MLIEMCNVCKRYGRRVALDEVNLSLQPQEVVGLAGPNGAGKTTLLSLLMGFLRPDSGSIRVLGSDPVSRRGLAEIGWMSERPAFPTRLRLSDILALHRKTFPTWKEERATELLERLSIDPGRRAENLSRGQLARFSLLLALAHRPRLLLLDDPALGLDPYARRVLLGEVLAASAEDGTAILLSTHLLDEIAPALDRLVILDQGRITLDRPVGELHSDGSERHGAPSGSAGTLEEIFVAHTGGSP